MSNQATTTLKMFIAANMQDAITNFPTAEAIDTFLTEYLDDSFSLISFDKEGAKCHNYVGCEVVFETRLGISGPEYTAIKSPEQRKDVENMLSGLKKFEVMLAETRGQYERLLAK